jgi:hypothetical protein
MRGSAWRRRRAILGACPGASAILGVASAAAAFPGENIYGMGSSLQAIDQIAVSGPSGTMGVGGACGGIGWLGWLGVWRCAASDHSTLNNDPFATYTIESSGVGLAEFGNAASSGCPSTTGVLSPACDPTADGQSPTEFDAYIATDDPPMRRATSRPAPRPSAS